MIESTVSSVIANEYNKQWVSIVYFYLKMDLNTILTTVALSGNNSPVL